MFSLFYSLFFPIVLQLLRFPRNVEEETKYIELMIVNDHIMVRFASPFPSILAPNCCIEGVLGYI